MVVPSDAAEPYAMTSVAAKQGMEIEHRAPQRPDSRGAHVPDDKPPPYSQVQEFNGTELTGTNSSHQSPADAHDAYESLHQSQNGISNQDEDDANIEELRKELEQYKEQAQETANKLKHSLAQYSKLVKEFNKAKVQSQSHMIHHVTDRELSEKVEGLLYNISTFAIQCFEATPPSVELSFSQSVVKYFQLMIYDPLSSLKHFGLKWNEFSDIMQSNSSRRISVVQALIWATLCETLFGQFVWTGDKVAGAIMNMKEFLDPDAIGAFREDRSPALQRWHTWRANTTIVILEDLAEEAKACQNGQEKFGEGISKPLESILNPFVAEGEHDAFATGLRDIVREAMDLDKVMNKQVPALTWIHKLEQLREKYCSDEMEFDPENQSEPTEKDDWLIVEPGLKRIGKSTGQDFDQVTILSKTTLVGKSNANTTRSKEPSARGSEGSLQETDGVL